MFVTVFKKSRGNCVNASLSKLNKGKRRKLDAREMVNCMGVSERIKKMVL